MVAGVSTATDVSGCATVALDGGALADVDDGLVVGVVAGVVAGSWVACRAEARGCSR